MTQLIRDGYVPMCHITIVLIVLFLNVSKRSKVTNKN